MGRRMGRALTWFVRALVVVDSSRVKRCSGHRRARRWRCAPLTHTRPRGLPAERTYPSAATRSRVGRAQFRRHVLPREGVDAGRERGERGDGRRRRGDDGPRRRARVLASRDIFRADRGRGGRAAPRQPRRAVPRRLAREGPPSRPRSTVRQGTHRSSSSSARGSIRAMCCSSSSFRVRFVPTDRPRSLTPTDPLPTSTARRPTTFPCSRRCILP